MELLVDWIGPRISQALADALEWKSRDAPVAADGDAKFLDDGNSIHIKSVKKEFAQIIKIEDFSEPVQLWLSDARTKLKVVIAAEATFFPEGDRKRVTDRTLGGLVQLLDYEIVAQCHGPKRTKLSMVVTKLKHTGSDGSGVFGNPCHVESLQPVIEMLDQLERLRAQESPVRQSLTPFKPPKDIPSKDHAPSPSQATSISSADDNLDKSQALFATQVPGLPSRKRRREGSLKVDENQPDFVDKAGTTRSTALTMGGTGGTPVSGPDSMYPHGAEVMPLHADQHLSSKPRKDQVEPESFHKSVQSLAKEDVVLDTSTTAAQDSTATERHCALLSLLGPPKGANNNRVQPQTTVATATHIHHGVNGPKSTPSPVGKGIVATDLPYQRQITPGATEAHKPGIKSFSSSEKGNRVSKTPKISNPPARLLKALYQSRKTLTRISGREVRIPKNQKDILDRSDSWCPPEPGNRAPTANVPISILQELNDRAERKVRTRGSSAASVTSRSLKRDQSSQTPSETGGDDSGSSKSDEPIPSADWPASSPERTNPPPDSSAESSEDLEQVNDQGSELNPNSNYATGTADDLSPSKRTALTVSSFKSSLDSNEEALKGLEGNIANVQASTARPKMSLLEFKKLRKDAMSNSSPREADSYANDDKAQANKTHLDAFEKNTTAPALHPPMKTKQISPLLPPSKMIKSSLLSHDEIDEQSSKDLSPITVRNAETYYGSDSLRKVEKDSPDTDSDLETSIPHGLDRTVDIPSTFRDDQEPVLQVGRTPYVHSVLKPLSAYSTEAKNGVLRDKPMFRQQSHKPLNSGDLSAAATSITRQNAISEQDDNLEVDVPVSTIEETKLPPSIPSQRSEFPRNMQATKRKASEPVVLSPNVTKRRKAFRADRAGSEHDSRHEIADPRDFGRQHRNEVLALLSEKAHHNIVALDTPASAKEESSNMDFVSKNESSVQNHTDELQAEIKSEDTLGHDHARSQVFHSLPQSTDVVHETRLEDSEASHEHKSSPNLVPVAEQSVADVFPASEKGNIAEDPKVVDSDLPKPTSQFAGDMRQNDDKVPSNLFGRFKVAYPDYPGNQGHFAAICRRIALLVRNNRMEHPSLWDDFAIRHRTEYTQYSAQCNDDAVDQLPYERFYREKVSQTKYSCPSGLVLTRNSISDFLPQETFLQRESKSGSSTDDLFIPQSTEIDDEVSAGSPAATGREVAYNVKNSNNVLPDSGAIDNGQVSRARGADRLRDKTHPIAPTPQRQQSRPSSHEPSFRSSSNDTRFAFALGADKLFQDLVRPKGGTKKEVIELTSDSEDQQSGTSPRRPPTSTARPKGGRRSLPWTKTNSQPSAKASDTAKTVASTPTPSVPTHERQLSASTSKAGIPKESRPFAAFGPAKSGQEDLIGSSAPTNHKPSKDKNAEKPTQKPSEIDDEDWKKVKKFIRNYEAISPGKGNSWAQELSQGNEASKRKPKMKERLVDPLDWEL